MIATLGPLCIVAALSGVHAAAPSLLAVRWKDFAGAQCSRCSRSRAAPFSLSAMPAPASTLPSDAAVRQLRERTVQAVLIVMFLVYPSASTEIVKSFRYGVGCWFRYSVSSPAIGAQGGREYPRTGSVADVMSVPTCCARKRSQEELACSFGTRYHAHFSSLCILWQVLRV